MKVYIAGKLSDDSEREMLEEMAKLCESLGMKTFLPHRDAGLARDLGDVKGIFKKDIIEGFKDCELVVADLNGLHVGAGTAWELGYAYANKIPAVGIKTDEEVKDALESLSSILIASMSIVTSMKELEEWIKKFKKK